MADDDLSSMMSGGPSKPETDSGSLGTVAIVFAVLLPIVGLILGIVAITRRTGRVRYQGIWATAIAGVLMVAIFVITVLPTVGNESTTQTLAPSQVVTSTKGQLATPELAAAKAREWLEAELAATPGSEAIVIGAIECRAAPIQDAVKSYILSSWRCSVDSVDGEVPATNIVEVSEGTGTLGIDVSVVS